jgi:DNA-binding transcriptional MerR regulator
MGVRRGAWYTERHLRQLLAIRQLQDGNLTLDAIGRRIKGANAGARRDTQEEFFLGAAQMAPESDARELRVIPIAPGLDLVVDTTEAGVDESVLPKLRTEIRRIYRAIRKEDSK